MVKSFANAVLSVIEMHLSFTLMNNTVPFFFGFLFVSQALQPNIKDIQAKYQSNPEVMNQKIAEIYQANNVNPLAGCIPSLVQIPIFVGLYRAVLDLANEDKLNEPFLWLPSLEGPVYGADPTKGSAWLFEGWSNGAPSLGWEDTIAFLILPIFLVISQYLSMELMTPKEQKAQQPAFLKVLPLMIGWFSLNVPSALCVYWVTNNIITTATSVIIRNNLKMEPVTVGGPSSTPPPKTTDIFAPPPMREKPAGFGSPSSPPPPTDGVTPITSSTAAAAIDAEIVEVEDDDTSGEGMQSTEPSKVRESNPVDENIPLSG
jgi:YidC/Oxa1 family membrane protein insertase